MAETGSVKHQEVRAAIMAAIRSGEFQIGHRLPSERELAERFGVSYMTARRAVSEMVEADLLERRPRQGTYILSHSRKRLSTTTVNLICTAYGSSTLKTFLRLGARAAAARGWRNHMIRLQIGHERPAVRAVESGELALVLVSGPELQGALGAAMQRAQGRAILIGNRLDSLGVPSVLADDAQAIRLAVEHLKSAGHRAIALLSDRPDHAVDRVQIAAWRSCFLGEWNSRELEKRLIVANTPLFEHQPDYAYQAVRRYLAGKQADATALISLSDEMTLAALAACRDADRPVPQKMSLINSGDSSLMAFANPGVSCVDIRLEQHIQQAFEMLEAALAGNLPSADLLRLVEPRLVARQSVAPATA